MQHNRAQQSIESQRRIGDSRLLVSTDSSLPGGHGGDFRNHRPFFLGVVTAMARGAAICICLATTLAFAQEAAPAPENPSFDGAAWRLLLNLPSPGRAYPGEPGGEVYSTVVQPLWKVQVKDAEAERRGRDFIDYRGGALAKLTCNGQVRFGWNCARLGTQAMPFYSSKFRGLEPGQEYTIEATVWTEEGPQLTQSISFTVKVPVTDSQRESEETYRRAFERHREGLATKPEGTLSHYQEQAGFVEDLRTYAVGHSLNPGEDPWPAFDEFVREMDRLHEYPRPLDASETHQSDHERRYSSDVVSLMSLLGNIGDERALARARNEAGRIEDLSGYDAASATWGLLQLEFAVTGDIPAVRRRLESWAALSKQANQDADDNRSNWPFELAGSSEPLEIDIVDANPSFYHDQFPQKVEAESWADSQHVREGTSADGVSQIVVRVRSSAEQRVGVKVVGRDGSVEPLGEQSWQDPDGAYWSFFLYTPPEVFGGGATEQRPASLMDPGAQPLLRLEEVLEYRNIVLEVAAGDMGPVESFQFKLARPPVVLVHGLSSEPVDCWVRTKGTGTSFVVILEKSGFMPFLVNYQKSNGMPMKDGRKDSSFEANKRVVWESPDPHVPQDPGYPWLMGSEPPPIVSAFQAPAGTRIGGIKAAVEYYRNELKLAATQADCIGHSMGGLLSRIWASPNYNPDYKRAENFEMGDIHRLITICTPHFGTELADVKDVLQAASPKGETWSAWIRRFLVGRILNWFLEPEPKAIRDLRADSAALKRIGPTKVPSFAITTSFNMSELKFSDPPPARQFLLLYAGVGAMFFHNPALLDEFIDQRAAEWAEDSSRRRNTDWAGNRPSSTDGIVDWGDEGARDRYSLLLREAVDKSAYFWAQLQPQDDLRNLKADIRKTYKIPWGLFDSDPDHDGHTYKRGVVETLAALASKATTGGDLTKLDSANREQDVPYEVMEIIRSLIFHNDADCDGAVRVVSQAGGIESSATVKLPVTGLRKDNETPGIPHSLATWHYLVQRKTVDLLKWEDDQFSREGFPEAGQPSPRYMPTSAYVEDRVAGDTAVRWSGLVPSHAEQFLQVADEDNVIVIVRPVNPDSTDLIAHGAATKGMAIKGKSSNWGPHRGLIPVEQRFSKLWRVFAHNRIKRDDEIKKYDEINAFVLNDPKAVYPPDPERPDLMGRRFAVRRALVVEAGGVEYRVRFDPQEPDSEKAIVLEHDAVFYSWHTADEVVDGNTRQVFDRAYTPDKLSPQPPRAVTDRFLPFEVLADGLETPPPGEEAPYLTADYDLLAIGFSEPGANEVPAKVLAAPFHELRGKITEDQVDLLVELNTAVQEGTGYRRRARGKVVHHGPENQYGGSPYVDYPLLVLDPGEEGEGDGEMFLIRQGPIGFRDIHLKRYFTEKIRDGFNLYPNPSAPGWKWEDWRDFRIDLGYDPRDSRTLLAYVAEAPRPKDHSPQSAAPADESPPESDVESPESIEAALYSAEARVEQEELDLRMLAAGFERISRLYKMDMVSEEDFDSSRKQMETATAQLDADRAEVERLTSALDLARGR